MEKRIIAMLDDWRVLHGRGFNVSVVHECEKCHKKALTVQEPADTGKWLCRRCYHGSDDSFVAKARGVQRGF